MLIIVICENKISLSMISHFCGLFTVPGTPPPPPPRMTLILQEKCSVLTYDNSQIGFAKLISLLFLSIRNCCLL